MQRSITATAAMLAFLGRFLPKLGGVRFAGVAFFLPAGGGRAKRRASRQRQPICARAEALAHSTIVEDWGDIF
jgi:hypothetical protein